MKKGLFILIAVIMSAFFLVRCGNVVPPGMTVIIVKPDGETTIHKNGAYKAWNRDRAYFVDGKLKSFKKDLKILCADDINMSVSVKWVGSFLVTDQTISVIKAKVPAKTANIEGNEVQQLSLDAFFRIAMADIMSSITRDTVSPYNTDNIREQRDVIRQAIKKEFLKRMKELKYPISTADLLITNLDYPKNVTAMRQKIKHAELADLENAAIAKANVAKAKRDAELESERGKASIVKAKIDAAANKIRSTSLTPAILAVKQLETLVTLAQGTNNTVVVIPFDAIRPGGLQDTILMKSAIDNGKRIATK